MATTQDGGFKKDALYWEVTADAECMSQTFNQIILTSG